MSDDPNPTDRQIPQRTVLERLHYALGPMAGGMIIDLADLLTPGPVGLFGGILIGMPVGWYVASMYGFETPSRLLIATLTGIYCTIPGTELIPLATLVSACGRFFAEDRGYGGERPSVVPPPPGIAPEKPSPSSDASGNHDPIQSIKSPNSL